MPVIASVVIVVLLGYASWQQKNNNTELQRFIKSYDGQFEIQRSWLHSYVYLIHGRIHGMPFELGVEFGNNRSSKFSFHLFPTDPLPEATFTKHSVFSSSLRYLSRLVKATGRPSLEQKYQLDLKSAQRPQVFNSRQFESRLDVIFSHRIQSLTLRRQMLTARGSGLVFSEDFLSNLVESLAQLIQLIHSQAGLEAKPISKTESESLSNSRSTIQMQAKNIAHCPYCKDAVDSRTDQIVSCQSCNTLHHKECFESRQHCSVFGCDGGVAQSSQDAQSSSFGSMSQSEVCQVK